MNNKRQYKRRDVLMGLTASCIAAPAFASDAATVNLVAADVHIASYPTVAAIRWMGDYLEKHSDGHLRLRVMHSGQLGRENDTIDLARYSVIDLTRVYIGALNNAVPESQVLALPYVFDSVAHMRRAVDGEVGKQVLAAMSNRNLVGLALYDSGPRCFYNSHHAIHTPDDLRGLKLRVPVSDIFIDLIRALGGNPTPLSYSDTYSAMQTHLIDGAENNWSSFQSSRHFEVAKFWAQSEHSYAPDILLMSADRLNSLSANDQELVRDAAAQSVTFMRTLWDQDEQKARAMVLAAGVHISEIDRNAFRQAAAPVLKKYANQPAIAPLLAAIQRTA